MQGLVGSTDGVGSCEMLEIASKAARAASLSFFDIVFPLEPAEVEDAEVIFHDRKIFGKVSPFRIREMRFHILFCLPGEHNSGYQQAI